MEHLDETLRAAMKALDDRGPAREADYFDEMSAKIEARLAGERDDSEGREAMDHVTTEGTATPTPTDDSGLHDIKALARTTRRRVSQRISSQHDIDESFLSSSQSGMRAVALPEPARLVALPSIDQLAGATPAVARAAEKVAAESAGGARPRRRAPMMWIAGGGLAAAAALVAVVVINTSRSKSEREASMGMAGSAAPASAAAAGSGGATPTPERAPVPSPPQADRQVRHEANTASLDVGAPSPGSGAASGSAAGSGSAAITSTTTAPKGSGAGDVKVGHGTGKPTPTDGKKIQTGGGGTGALDKGKVPDKHKAGDPKSLDDLIDEAAGGAGSPTRKPDAAKAVLDKKELTSSDVRTGMSSVSKRAQACYDKFGVAGTVGVKAVVAASGAVTKVSATGAFAGTPTGDCVAQAVSSVSFPAWDGPPMTINYSYLLAE